MMPALYDWADARHPVMSMGLRSVTNLRDAGVIRYALTGAVIFISFAATLSVGVLAPGFATLVPITLGAVVGLVTTTTTDKGLGKESKDKLKASAMVLLFASAALALLSPGGFSDHLLFNLWPVVVLLVAALAALFTQDRRIANAYNTALLLIVCNLALGLILAPTVLT